MNDEILTSKQVLLNTLNDMHEGNLATYLEDNPEELKIYSEPILKWGQSLVEAALKAAWESWEFEEGCDTHGVSLKEESIINAYPKTNII